eukprot:CAMPEP_0184527148 /NCGR_PEP_ID=MMETSP0198_2-20121128/11041_1 /TAXON_ID=1112570 /ORGANISM="Thraustochytrium sp., Strain LLF1b" /LENGTH=197 /DNA_ID=CAMNT_0026918783 /DNA_START=92 /DNA_END=685 /DNA_ORIENTATION=-
MTRRSLSQGPEILDGMSEEELKKKIQPLAPKRLTDILLLDKLQDKSGEEIAQIWDLHHAEKKDCVSVCLKGHAWRTLAQRSAESPVFVFPVVKSLSQFYTLLAQWDANHCVMTYLEDYQKDPKTAVPYFYLVAYPEFLASKDLVLVRGEFLPYLTKDEARVLLGKVVDMYGLDEKYEHVKTFNHNPNSFDFAAAFKE